MSEFLYHESCSECGSSDARAVYENGSYCWSCMAHTKSDTEETGGGLKVGLQVTEGTFSPLEMTIGPLPKRKLTEESCRHWGIGEVDWSGGKRLAVSYRSPEGAIAGYKLRSKTKDFSVHGKLPCLYGQWLWKEGGKKIVVTEGELDAVSLSQMQGHKWPVVSIPNGAPSAAKAFKENIEWLESFDEVIIMFDMDEPGQKASLEAAEVLSPGKALIAYLPLKDPSEMLQAGRGAELMSAMWNAKTWRPDGIITGDEIWEKILEEDTERTVSYPWQGLQDLTYGLRSRELVVICAGTGIGKSTICRELAYHLVSIDEKVGYIALEESVKRTALGIIGVHISKPLHLSMDGVTQDELQVAFGETVDKMCLYDHFGSMASDRLLSRMRYMVVSMGVQWIFLDHLSIVISGDATGDERRNIDVLMTKLRSFVQETGVGLVLVSHLKRPEGKSFEEGAQVRLSHLRGSASIEQLSDRIIGAERNMQGEESSNRMNLRLLKNRHVGINGLAGCLDYDLDTGRLTEVIGEDFD